MFFSYISNLETFVQSIKTNHICKFIDFTGEVFSLGEREVNLQIQNDEPGFVGHL